MDGAGHDNDVGTLFSELARHSLAHSIGTTSDNNGLQRNVQHAVQSKMRVPNLPDPQRGNGFFPSRTFWIHYIR